MHRNTAIHSHATTIGYCTNVHAGTDLESIRENLIRYSLPVRDLVGGQSLGVGLWIPNDASKELIDGGAAEFAEFLRSRRLAAFTINGFPFSNFHQDVVKHDVYSPAWWDDARLEYTRRLAAILAVILDESQTVGSISTLPIGWGKSPGDEKIHRAGANLRAMADSLEKLESTSGRRIVLAIEPEPGCYLDTVGDCLAFFEKELPDESHRRYITVCHDVCHSAVMMEDQRDVLSRLATAGIGVGKVQVSSAILADWESMATGRRHEAIDQLRDFAEDRYLHQTGRKKSDGSFELVEDLPGLLDGLPTDGDPVAGDQRWVIHFHVPIFLERFRHLSTTHDEVGVALRTLDNLQGSLDFTGHLEIETYAWTVLPESMRRRGLSEDIASEIEWLKRQQDQ
ncbi:metabolite traffic protein EboE [Crateriforma spongiae]|uniref:metabolite traffic protein EboE n=1 Tax=Crateriforma spongiae TaxID=2724528 RepID=UPI001447B99F|nr:metabolite traffic protein EboE [Crateriforma spongiae]